MSRDEVIASIKKAIANAQDKDRLAAYQDAHAAEFGRVRECIVKHLAELEKDLGQFLQTTHGCLFIHGIDIEGVCREIVTTYKHDGKSSLAYNVSNLAQSIRAFTKAVHAPETR